MSQVSKVILERHETSEQGTFGKFIFNNFNCFTGELPDQDNLSNVSCIPKGTYNCVWSYSPAFKREMYEILNVPKRSGIRIHSANFMGNEKKGYKKQLNGCIALGEKLGEMDYQKALLVSKPAVRQFETLMNEQPFILEIV